MIRAKGLVVVEVTRGRGRGVKRRQKNLSKQDTELDGYVLISGSHCSWQF